MKLPFPVSVDGVVFLGVIALLCPTASCDKDVYCRSCSHEIQCPHSASSSDVCKVRDKLIYHQTMTPSWFEGHASFIDGYHSTTADLITFNPGSKDNAILLKVPLIPCGVLKDCTQLTVEITVANDITIGQINDSDIRYGLSDGTNFVGFEAPDLKDYRKYPPCYGVEGTSGKSLTDISFKKKDEKNVVTNRFYSGHYFFTFKLDQRWGSCYTALHRFGFLKTAGYNNRLKLSKGLTLEVYKSEKGERVGIKFIKVAIMEDSSCK